MYLVLESILFVLTEGCSWRAIDRPQARWNSVYQYFRRWCHRGTLQKVLTQFGPELAPGWHFVDSTHVKPIFNSQRQFLLGRCSPGAASRAIEVLRPQKCSAISLPKSFSTLL